MAEIASRFNGSSLLHPSIEPFDRRMLPVGDGHSIYVEQCGSSGGPPILFLHGGPGGGCNPTMRRFFDPGIFRIVLFDQRGCGRSQPAGSVENNTTWHLVEDIERIRRTLGIDRWILFGGSWGATLALVYALNHPDRVAHLVLRGVFLMTREELNWFYGGPAGRFRPDRWSRFIEPIPAGERVDLIKAYERRLFAGDLKDQHFYAQRWLEWESAMLTLEQGEAIRSAPSAYAHTFARIENHYFRNRGFLGSDNYIMDNVARLRGIPGDIVQGRYDLICPPHAAWHLSENWPDARLHLVQAGHSLSEQETTRALLEVMKGIGQQHGGDRNTRRNDGVEFLPANT